ncbi:MAG: nicotinamide mononucleotide transporter [Bacteroidales bacterium]|nr:nicotinamide mononucleotide transporter [Bacteroidales bacterium]
MIDVITQYFAEMTPLRLCVLLGTLTGLVVMVLQVLQHIALWYFNIISATLLAINFFATEVYAYAVFQIYYVVVSVYGLYEWKRGRSTDDSELPIQLMKVKDWMIALAVIVGGTLVVSNFLWLLGSDIAFVDALITVISAVATFLLTKKFLQYWYFWIVADSIYIALVFYYGQSDLYPTVILYACYVISAIIGIIEWRKMYRKQELVEAKS